VKEEQPKPHLQSLAG